MGHSRALAPPRSAPRAVPARGAALRGRKARERAARCAEVLAVARRLYARKGYQRTSMVEIARASELAVGTLYQLFPSKEAILRALLEAQMDRLITRVQEAAGDEPDVRAQLRRIVLTHLAFARENADILRLYLSGWIGYDVTVRQRYGERIDARYERYLTFLARVLQRGIETGALGAHPPPPRRRRLTPRRLVAGLLLAALALTGTIYAVAWWRHARDHVSTDDAYVTGRIAPVSARVAGHVAAVLVDDNQDVQAGDVLVRLDPRDYEVALAQARAAVEAARADLRNAMVNVPLTDQTTRGALGQAEAALAAMEQGTDRARHDLEERRSELTAKQAAVAAARAAVRA